jgi:DNA invertase Pin-like site-specific DNA recombinase
MQPQRIISPGTPRPESIYPNLDEILKLRAESPDVQLAAIVQRYRPPARPPLGEDGEPLDPADAYLRESQKEQGEYSPVTQFVSILEDMSRRGYYCAFVRYDSERGRVTTRKGYNQILERARRRETEAVFCYMLERWGRNGSERLRAGGELDRLKVPVISVKEGVDEPGLIRYVRAGMDEEFSRKLSLKMVDNLPIAVKDGIYLGRTPIGYRRVFPADAVHQKHPRPDMVPDDDPRAIAAAGDNAVIYRWLVHDVFVKWARNGWSIRAIVTWLNSNRDTHPNPYSATGVWTRDTVRGMLKKRAYIGETDWGHEKVGYYNAYEGPVLNEPTRHPAIIERDLWEEAQMRFANEDQRTRKATRKGRTPCLLSGFLFCSACGGPMHGHRPRPGGSVGEYVCGARIHAPGECHEPSCSLRRAEEAVLREVARLQAHKTFTPQLLESVGQTQAATERAEIERAIAAKRSELDRNAELLRRLGDVDAEAVESFRRTARRIGDDTRALEAHLAELPADEVDPLHLKDVHAWLAQTTIADEIAEAQADEDVLALRKILEATVESARMVERVPFGRDLWVRAEVTWTRDIAVLLEAGLLTLAPAPEPPARTPLSPAERARRYRERKRAANG